MSENTEVFGSKVFSDSVMQDRLPADAYRALRRAVIEGESLDENVAATVANAMQVWAIENGATHYIHWFEPMNGSAAEKRHNLIGVGRSGRAIIGFSGRDLILSEPENQCGRPSGPRALFEARGRMIWDISSFAFIKERALCIPTVFCDRDGGMLDKKAPLLRSNKLINDQALRVLKALGDRETVSVSPTVGVEQEYFILDKTCFDQRPDLKSCGRTLFGARPAKIRGLESAYSGPIRPRVLEFMRDLDRELFKLGICTKTEHNEAAPAQYELACMHESANLACDHDRLTMEFMFKTAERHGLAVVLSEKPFAGISGSGKHCNWSLATDKGANLLSPGFGPDHDLRRLLIISAIIKAADEHQDILRIAAAGAGNDRRLGVDDAPPATVCLHIERENTTELEALCEDGMSGAAGSELRCALPACGEQPERDSGDLGRTSPLSFSGNKLEFRMPGASGSVTDAILMLNTAVGDVLRVFADRLEAVDDAKEEAASIIRETYSRHKRIVLDGDCRSTAWANEAEERGLLNLKTCADALPRLLSDINVALFERCGILNEKELRMRHDALADNYCRAMVSEALTMYDMAKRMILPAAISYGRELAGACNDARAMGMEDEAAAVLAGKLYSCSSALRCGIDNLGSVMLEASGMGDGILKANYIRDRLIPAMNSLRGSADELETTVSRDYWPMPTYGELLYSV